jgi:protein-disulfide isomerase
VLVVAAVAVVILMSGCGSAAHPSGASTTTASTSDRPNASTSTSTSASASAVASQARITAAEQHVRTLLTGISEASDDVLGKTTAPITIIEYGDLECAVCDAFALGTDAVVSDGTHGTGIENEIIDKLVKTGRAKLVYDALDTATSDGATPGEFVAQQAAAYAAGLQDKAWYFIELFYNEQHPEGTDYVNQSFLNAIALQVPGLNYTKWLIDSRSAKLRAQVLADNTRGDEVDGGMPGTPTIVVQSKTHGVVAAEGIPTFAQVKQAIQAVQFN